MDTFKLSEKKLPSRWTAFLLASCVLLQSAAGCMTHTDTRKVVQPDDYVSIKGRMVTVYFEAEGKIHEITRKVEQMIGQSMTVNKETIEIQKIQRVVLMDDSRLDLSRTATYVGIGVLAGVVTYLWLIAGALDAVSTPP